MRFINWVTASLVVIIFLAAFFLSFTSISDLAKENGIKYYLLYPVILDGFIVTAAMFRLRNSLLAETTKLDAPLVILATIVSIAFNVLHAPEELLPQFMAGLIPVVLFAAFELYMWMLEKSISASMHKESREQQWRKRTRFALDAARAAAAEAEVSAKAYAEMQEVNANLQSRVQKQVELLSKQDADDDADDDAGDAYTCACGKAYTKHQSLAAHSRFCNVANAEREAVGVSSNGHR